MDSSGFTPTELARIAEIRKSLDGIIDGGMTKRERDLHLGLFSDEDRALIARWAAFSMPSSTDH